MVLLIVGKAGAGKSTHAARLAEELKADGLKVRVLDGDIFRATSGNQDFSDAGRRKNLKAMAESAALAELEGFMVIVAAMAPKREWRDMMRDMWRGRGRLVYLPGGSLWDGTEYERPEDVEF